MLSEREYKYWIIRNCNRINCWLVYDSIIEMTSHEGTVIIPSIDEDLHLPLTPERLQYVYFVEFIVNRMITLVQDSNYYYLIDNINGDVIKSTITFNSSLQALVKQMPSNLRKKLNLKTIDKANLKKSDMVKLNNILPIDFIGQTHISQVKLFRDLCNNNKNVRLDLSGYQALDTKVIEDVVILGKIKLNYEEVIVYQNHKVNNLRWLKHFNNVKVLSIWYNNSLQNHDFDHLLEDAPGLQVLELHSCFKINGRVLLPLSKLKLDKLVIDNEKCELQEVFYETVITNDEWKTIDNVSLDLVLINSNNLTLDFIDYFLKSFKKLRTFIMNDLVLEKLEKNSKNGLRDRENYVSFHSSANTQHGFTRYRDVIIYDQVKNKCGALFSESMLRKVKENSPDKADIVNILLKSDT